MSFTYTRKKHESHGVTTYSITRVENGRVKVFPDPALENTDYIKYKEWVDEGNTPEGDTD
tara:strand:- start:43 stop:222 length:180 start_codon:yes stop_codon:yes gene_type:complete